MPIMPRAVEACGRSVGRLMDDPAEIDRVLRDGAERAAAAADPVLAETKRLVGFWS